MRTKVTIALLLLNAILFSYIYFHLRGSGKADTEITTILGSEALNIQTLTIERPNVGPSGETIRIERRGDNWQVTAPIDWPANLFAVRPIITNLQTLRSETSFSIQDLQKNGQTLADYGLDKPSQILTFTTAAHTPPIVLKIGSTTKVGNRLYILSPDGERVHIVLRTLADSLGISLDTLRTDTLFTIPVFEARSLNIELASGVRIRFRRDAERWAIEAPIQARASKNNTELAINNLNSLRVGRFADTSELTIARASLTTPQLSVTLEGNNRIETLFIGGKVPDTTNTSTPTATQSATTTPTETGTQAAVTISSTTTVTSGTTTVASAITTPSKSSAAAQTADAAFTGAEASSLYYAQLDNRKNNSGPFFTVRIPDVVMETLRDAQQTLREIRILDIDPLAATSVSIVAAAQAEVLLQRLESGATNPGGASWQIVRRTTDHGPQSTPADRDTIDRFLRNLARLSTLDIKKPDGTTDRGFVNDAPSDAEKENYGFTSRPAREITLTLAPASPGAMPVTATLQIGSGADHNTYARLLSQSQNYIYRVSPRILDEASASPLAYREHLIRELPAGAQITALKLTDTIAKKVLLDTALPLPSSSDSTTPQFDAAKRAATEALVAQLRALHAKNFISDEFTENVFAAGENRPWQYQLDATITLNAGTTSAQTTTMQLFLTARIGGTTQLAGSQAYGAIFEIEQPMIDALQTLER